MIRLRTLGESIIEVDGVAYTPQFDTLFAALVYLTAERGRRVTRQTLAELLWPNQDLSRGRHCLRQLLYRMRVSGCPVEGGRDTLLLPESLVMPTFSAAPAAERLVAERATGAMMIGPFLPGYVPPFSDAFTEWVERTRGAMDARVRRVLLEVAHAHKLRGEWDQVDVLAAEVLRIDPLNEEATLARAEATAMVGAKTEAVAILDRYMVELGPERAQLQLPAAVLRKRIAERFPARRYGGTSDQIFVGRADLMETLSTALLRARKSEGSGVLLTGAPGVGKTRLVQELAKVAAMQGVRVARTSVAESDAEQPLAAFADVVPQLRTLKGAIGVSPQSLEFLNRLTEPPPPAAASRNEEVRDPRWIASRIRQAIVDLCDAVTIESTLLLVVEDVHWLDTSSWAVLAAILDSIAIKRLLVVLTSRDLQATSAMPQRCAERLIVHPVAALNAEASATYTRAIGAEHEKELHSEAVRWCLNVGEGNPLFLRELVMHRLDGGALGSIPPSLQALLDARIARLDAPARRVLEAAVLLGDFATPDRLGAVLELPAHELAAALHQLSTRELLDDGTTLVSPRHPLLSTRVLDAMPKPVRRLLHGRVATVLTEGAGDRTPDALLVAAAHWTQAGDSVRGTHTLIRAAKAAQRIGALQEALRLLNTALERASDGPQRVLVLRNLIPALTLDHQAERAAALADELTRTVDPTVDLESRASDELLAVNAYYRMGSARETLIRRSEELARNPRLSAALRLRAARQALVVGVLSGVSIDRDLVSSLLKLRTSRESAVHLELLNLSIVFHANYGDLSVAITSARELLELAIAQGDAVSRLSYLVNVGHAFYYAGLNDEAAHVFELTRLEAHRVNARHYEAQGIIGLLSLALDDNDVEASRRFRDMWLGTVDPSQAWFDVLIRVAEIRIALMDGRHESAWRSALELLDQTHDASPLPLLQLREVLTVALEACLVSSDRLPEHLLTELLDCHRRMRHFSLHDRTVATLILALERQERRDEARELEHAYVHQQRRSLVPWTSASAILALDPALTSPERGGER